MPAVSIVPATVTAPPSAVRLTDSAFSACPAPIARSPPPDRTVRSPPKSVPDCVRKVVRSKAEPLESKVKLPSRAPDTPGLKIAANAPTSKPSINPALATRRMDPAAPFSTSAESAAAAPLSDISVGRRTVPPAPVEALKVILPEPAPRFSVPPGAATVTKSTASPNRFVKPGAAIVAPPVRVRLRSARRSIVPAEASSSALLIVMSKFCPGTVVRASACPKARRAPGARLPETSA